MQAPGLTLAVLGLATAVALAGLVDPGSFALRLRIDPSTGPLLPQGDPARRAYAQAVRDFGDDEIYAVAIECGDVFTHDCLSALDRAGTRIARLDGVRAVSSLADVTAFRWDAEREWIEIRPFIETVPEDPAALDRLRERALSDPVYQQVLVSADARAAALNVRFRKLDDAAFLASGLDAAVTAILSEEWPDTPHHVAGRPHVKVHVYRGILRDLGVLVPVALVVMAGVLLVFFGTLRGVLLPLAPAVIANVWTFGTIGWLGGELSLLTGLLAPMLLAVGSVYGVHVLARYEEEAARAATPAEAARATLGHVHRPALVAGATTVLGFAALLVTDVPAVFDLGAWAMLGIASATAVAVTGVPAALVYLPLPERPDPAAPRRRAADRALEAALTFVAGRVMRTPGALVAGFAVLTALSAAAIPRIDVDTDYLSYFASDDPVRRDFEAVNRLLAGVVPLYVVVEGSEPGSLREPALLRSIERMQARIDALPAVGRTLSIVEPLRQLAGAFAGGDPEAERIPPTRAAVTELLFMLPKEDLSRFATVDHARANVVVRTGAVGSSAVQALAAELEAAVRADPPPDAGVTITGNALLLARSADGIARGQPRSVAAAAVGIAILVTWALGSVRLGWIAMLPNVIPVVIFFGALGLGAAPLSLPTSLIGCMALGVAIDDSVHLLARYRAEREAGASADAAVATAVRRVGRPIAITSVMLCLGFLVVTGSRFATLAAFGVLSAFTMVVCLVTDLVLLPAVLARTRP